MDGDEMTRIIWEFIKEKVRNPTTNSGVCVCVLGGCRGAGRQRFRRERSRWREIHK